MDIGFNIKTFENEVLVLWPLRQFIETDFYKLAGGVLTCDEEDDELLNDFVIERFIVEVEICLDERCNWQSLLLLFFLSLEEFVGDSF